MERTKHHRRELWDREASDLLRALLRLRTMPEARRFLRDLLTEDEIRMMVERWRVARLPVWSCSFRCPRSTRKRPSQR